MGICRHRLDAAASKVEPPDLSAIEPRPMEELMEAGSQVKMVQVPDEVVRKSKAKLQVIEDFNELWTSEGTGARSKVGVWRPTGEVGMRKANSVQIIVGDFATASFADPKKDKKKRMILEITDTSSNLAGGALRVMPSPQHGLQDADALLLRCDCRLANQGRLHRRDR
jgi:hypothetical protein